MLLFFYNLGVGHFEFKMADFLIQNLKCPLLGTILMQYKIKAQETIVTRDMYI